MGGIETHNTAGCNFSRRETGKVPLLGGERGHPFVVAGTFVDKSRRKADYCCKKCKFLYNKP